MIFLDMWRSWRFRRQVSKRELLRRLRAQKRKECDACLTVATLRDKRLNLANTQPLVGQSGQQPVDPHTRTQDERPTGIPPGE